MFFLIFIGAKFNIVLFYTRICWKMHVCTLQNNRTKILQGNFIVIPTLTFPRNSGSFDREVEGMCTSDSKTPLANVHHSRKATVQIRLDVQKHPDGWPIFPERRFRSTFWRCKQPLRHASLPIAFAQREREVNRGKVRGLVRSDAPHPRARKWRIDFVIRYVVGHQFSLLRAGKLADALVRVLFYRNLQTPISVPSSSGCLLTTSVTVTQILSEE